MKVRVRGALSAAGRIEQGLKQGGVLSTSLLTLYTDDKVRAVHESRLGAQFGDRKVGIIAYADDEVLISTDPDELQKLLDIAYEHSRIWRYRYGMSKCKVMIHGASARTTPWKLGEKEVEITEEYVHLGVLMRTKRVAVRRVEERMRRARVAFYTHTKHGAGIGKMSSLTAYTTWRIYAEPILVYVWTCRHSSVQKWCSVVGGNDEQDV